MSESKKKHNPSQSSGEPVLLNWGEIDFPSDHLSVKRLRTIFPEMFDNGSALSNGFSYFFSPTGDGEPAHLDKLNDLISAERTLADYAFYHVLDSVDDRCRAEMQEAKGTLELLYQEFKLADSPETARLLMRHIEEQGAQQGKHVEGPAR